MCQFYLANGLSSSTCQVCGLAQRQFLEFCSQDIPSDLGHSLPPASEQTLMHLCARLADRLHHSSIKVYLSAVRSLHIDYGYPDPLSNCLQLQHLLRGIKRHQGSKLSQRQPVTADLMCVLHLSSLWIYLTWTMSCCEQPVSLASSGSFELGIHNEYFF